MERIKEDFHVTYHLWRTVGKILVQRHGSNYRKNNAILNSYIIVKLLTY